MNFNNILSALLFYILFNCSNIIYAQGNWYPQTSSTTVDLHSVYFVDANNGWAVGDNGIILTTINGGAMWQIIYSSTTNSLSDVYFADPNTGYSVGRFQTVLKSTNGGADWDSLLGGSYFESLNTVYFIDQDTGWIAGAIHDFFGGSNPQILKTTDGGSNWDYAQINGGSGWISSMYFTTDSTGWAVGGYWDDTFHTGGRIYESTDAGITWEYQSNPIETWGGLNSVFFINLDTGWAAGWGQGAVILKTIDGGTIWDSLSIQSVPNSIYFTNNQTGWAVGDNGIILTTTDGGLTWNPQSSGTLNHLKSVYFLNDSTGWGVGDSGTILKTTTGGVVPIEPKPLNDMNIPEAVTLFQNYPNPFNPSTTIEFSLPKAGYVTLKIYNIMGHEVASLVSEKLSAGIHKYDWNANDLASGVYFYKIEIDGHSLMKKTLLIK